MKHGGDDKPYLTLQGRARCEISPIKGSRFIGFACPIADETVAVAFLAQIKQQLPDARHWCWAYQLRHRPNQQHITRFSDDGEPNGSAGKPILAPIVGRELMDTMVVVTRYFGGVKLGVGGLVRAYSQATNAVLDAAEVVEVVPKIVLQLAYGYDNTGQIASALAALGLTETNAVYTDRITADLQITRADVERVSAILTDYTAGKIQLSVMDSSPQS